jgi:hypothetical protein
MPDIQQEKRQLQREIARQRRRIDRRLGVPRVVIPALENLPGAVGRHPGLILLAAFGGGLISGLGIKPSRNWARWAFRLWRVVRAGMGTSGGR